MKKIIMALMMVTGFTYFSAEAQTMPKACGKPDNKVCRRTSTGVSCYKTKYAENFAVCKGDYGYYVCCEVPNSTNSTFPALPLAVPYPYRSANQSNESYAMQNTNDTKPANGIPPEMIAPQSQSYPAYSANSATTYEGYYPAKRYIKVCTNSDNVAEENQAAYKGCPTPAYDGPDRNRERNINVSTPNANAPLAPITGNR